MPVLKFMKGLKPVPSAIPALKCQLIKLTGANEAELTEVRANTRRERRRGVDPTSSHRRTEQLSVCVFGWQRRV